MIKCLLWDFGDTLCDELSLFRSTPEWMAVYHSFFSDDGVGAAWSLGELDTAEVAVILAKRMSLSEAEILEHLSRVDLLEFFPFTYTYFRARHLPQAVVTVNPAMFRELAARLGFDQVVDSIVISGEEGTMDKGILCDLALERMPITCEPVEALLIDNRQDNLDDWAARGGAGYLYTTDEVFERDVANGVAGLINPLEQQGS